MDQPRTLPARGASILMVLCAALLLYRLGAVPLVGPDEPRYSRVAIEMKRSGDLVTPTLQGEPWLEKPILYYWLAAAAFSVLGENEAAARLPSVVALLATVAWTAILGSRLYGSRAGLLDHRPPSWVPPLSASPPSRKDRSGSCYPCSCSFPTGCSRESGRRARRS
jgi:predicted membrane-bound mannosyltransferase